MAGRQPRVVCWFSAGGPSAVAAKIALSEYGHDRVSIVYLDPGSEHPDNQRFIADAAEWFEHPVTQLKSDKYVDTWDVWDKRKFILGHHGAPCTVHLKKELRYAYQRPDDVQVFGYTADETKRVAQFRKENPGIDLAVPLVDRMLSREDCLALIDRAGLELPAMYRLGYHNANCIGCPKGGMGYWNKIRVDFPDTFLRMSLLERQLNHAIQKDDDGPVWLDEMDPERGDYPNEVGTECGLLCATTEQEIADAEPAFTLDDFLTHVVNEVVEGR